MRPAHIPTNPKISLLRNAHPWQRYALQACVTVEGGTVKGVIKSGGGLGTSPLMAKPNGAT
jgi:hypothetical protein